MTNLNQSLRKTLMSMVRRDLETRRELAAVGTLFQGYDPPMQAIHEENAGALDGTIASYGWPTRKLVGEDRAEAAWLVAQHAIGLPAFQRRCLYALQREVQRGEAPSWQAAMLLDRIRVMEARPQVYGTSFDWDDEGVMNPLPIEDAEHVDERRASVALPPWLKRLRDIERKPSMSRSR